MRSTECNIKSTFSERDNPKSHSVEHKRNRSIVMHNNSNDLIQNVISVNNFFMLCSESVTSAK